MHIKNPILLISVPSDLKTIVSSLLAKAKSEKARGMEVESTILLGIRFSLEYFKLNSLHGVLNLTFICAKFEIS